MVCARNRQMMGVMIAAIAACSPISAAAESSAESPQSAAAPSASAPATPAVALPKSIDELPNESAAVCLDYATILFYKARALLFQGKGDEAKAEFQNVGDALRAAMKRSEHDPDNVARALVRSQAAFMLGDLSFFVFKDRDGAKALYEESLHAISDHAGAQAALSRLSASEINNQMSGMKDQKPEEKSPK